MQGGNTTHGKDSGGWRRHLDAVLQGTRNRRRNRRIGAFRPSQAPERHVHRPRILVGCVPGSRAAGRRTGRRIRTGRGRPTARHGDSRRPRQRDSRRHAVERHQLRPAGCRSDREARRRSGTERRTGRPDRPRQAALGQGRGILPRRLLYTDQGGMGRRKRTRKRQENRSNLPATRLAELAHRRLRASCRRRGRPSRRPVHRPLRRIRHHLLRRRP